MMSIWKLRVGAENYYLSQVANGVEDYYTGRGEDSGRWLGTAATGLGLSLADPVVGDDLRAVLAGLQPGTGQSPNGGPPTVFKGRVPGFDLTFAAPKSVSVLYALGDPLVESVVVAAHDRAVDTALAWLEREACFVRRGSNNRARADGASVDFGTRRLPGAGFVAAGFRHRTSRAGDPHLHTHVLVANITRGPDGRWSALDAQGLYRAKHTAGAVFRTALAHELTEQLGVAWRPAGKGLIEIAGVPAEVLSTFSKRRSEIEAAMAHAGTQGAAAAADAMLATRAAKADVDPATMRDEWAAEAAALGFDTAALDTLLAGRHPLPDDAALVVRLPDPLTGEVVERQVRSGEFASWIGERMADVDSTCTRHQILEIVATYLPAGTSAAALEDATRWVLAQPELIPIPRPPSASGEAAGWEQRWTSHRLLTIETETTEAIADPTPVAVPPAVGYVEHVIAASTLGPDQAAAVRTLCGSGRTVSVLVGRAGTGKTYTLAAVREVLADFAGRRIIGVAPSARAARELADGAGVEAFTFPRFQLHQAASLAAGDVVIIDEAGMAATVDLHRVITQARRVGAQVILVGDHHQLPEIGAGGVFAAAVDLLGSDAAELTINRRQHAVWEHAALDELRHGNPQAGFRAYHEHGHVTIATTPAEVHQQAVSAWADAHRDGVNGVLLAGTRSEAKVLNRLARQHVADELSGRVLEVRGRTFQAGDRIVLLRNSPDSAGHLDLRYRRPTRVDNGMIGTIHRIRRDGRIDLKLVNGTPICVAADYVAAGHIDHGYATTIHKAQGITCDRMFLVGPTGLYREAVYVAMSRARHGSHLYATASQAAELVERPHTAGIPLPAEHVDELDFDVKQAVSQSRAKTLASIHDPLLPTISRIADEYHLDWLWNRHVHVRHTTTQLVADGYTDPTAGVLRLARARAHRQFLTTGTRVNAADWDNIGTVIAVIDNTGTAVVEFTSTDRTNRSQDPRVGRHPTRQPPRTRRPHPRIRRLLRPRPSRPRRTHRRLDRRPRRPRHPPRRDPPPPRGDRHAPPTTHARPRRRRPRLAHLLVRAPTHRPRRRPSLGRRDQPTRRLARRPPPRPPPPPATDPNRTTRTSPGAGPNTKTAASPPATGSTTTPPTCRHRRPHRPTSPPCANGSPNSTSSSPEPPSTRPGSSTPSTTANSTPADIDKALDAAAGHPERNDASGSSNTGHTSSNTPNSPSSATPTTPSPTGRHPSHPKSSDGWTSSPTSPTTHPTRHRSPNSTSDSPTPDPKPSSSVCNTSAQPCVNVSRSSTPPSRDADDQQRQSSTSIASASRTASKTSSGRSAATDHASPCGTGAAAPTGSPTKSNDASTTSPTAQSPHPSRGSPTWSASGIRTTPPTVLSDLHRLVSDVAAYRERACA